MALSDPFAMDAPLVPQTTIPRDRVLGVDPGAHGALALIGLGGGWPFLSAVDMPIRDRGKTVTNNVLDGKALARIVREWDPKIVVVEDVQPMPSRERFESGSADEPAPREAMPARHAFTFGGFCLGVVAVCEALGYDVVTVRPAVWKKAAQLRRVGDRTRADVKAESLARARDIWPQAPFERVKHEARAEAALIARFGLTSQMRFF